MTPGRPKKNIFDCVKNFDSANDYDSGSKIIGAEAESCRMQKGATPGCLQRLQN
jgi:hypothetical protein